MSDRGRPLRVLLTAFGSRGDVVPRVALGQELRRRGQGVTIACAGRFCPLVASYGVDAVKLGDYPTNDALTRAFARIAPDRDPGRRGDTLLRELLDPMLPGLLQELLAIEGPFDLVVLNELLATFAFPPVIEPGRLVFTLTTQPIGGFARLLRASPCIKLVGSSPMLLPPDHGLDETFEITDFWLPEERQAFRPDPVLEDFLSRPAPGAPESRPPVVAVAMGSAWGTDPVISRQTLAGAARRAGVRLVVQDFAPPPGKSIASADGWLISIGQVPYAWLFERVHAVLHHGGAGTIAEALRARCPSITVPHYGDHLYWAVRLEAAGLSAGMVLPSELNEPILAERIDRAVHDDGLRQSVVTAGSQLDAAGGVRAAVDWLEALAQQARSLARPDEKR